MLKLVSLVSFLSFIINNEIVYGDICTYKCINDGACTVTIKHDPPRPLGSPRGSIIGTCDPTGLGGRCKDTPAGCNRCSNECAGRGSGSFSKNSNGNQGNRRIGITTQPRPIQPTTSNGGGDTCTYTCQFDGKCRVQLVTKAFGNGPYGECASRSFGGSCSGIPSACQSCNIPCNGRDGQTFTLQANTQGNGRITTSGNRRITPRPPVQPTLPSCSDACYADAPCTAKCLFDDGTLNPGYTGNRRITPRPPVQPSLPDCRSVCPYGPCDVPCYTPDSIDGGVIQTGTICEEECNSYGQCRTECRG